jgi:hypothetical protein
VSRDDGSATHLEVASSSCAPGGSGNPPQVATALSLQERILLANIRRAGHPVSRAQLRDALRVNNNRLGDVLNDLERSGRVRRSDAGISLPP